MAHTEDTIEDLVGPTLCSYAVCILAWRMGYCKLLRLRSTDSVCTGAQTIENSELKRALLK
eukprot:1541778-Rhodomonas_salina.1